LAAIARAVLVLASQQAGINPAAKVAQDEHRGPTSIVSVLTPRPGLERSLLANTSSDAALSLGVEAASTKHYANFLMGIYHAVDRLKRSPCSASSSSLVSWRSLAPVLLCIRLRKAVEWLA
jgi:hypothetical protein